MDFIDFIYALGRDWITLMSGIFSVIFAILGFIKLERLQQLFGKNQSKIFWGMAILCFFLATVRVWTYEHREKLRLESDLIKEKDNNKPKFDGRINLMFVAPGGDKNENSLVTLTARIINTGAPSIASDFKVIIKIGDRQITTIDMFAPLEPVHLFMANSAKSSVTLIPEDWLPRKSMSQPIARGGAVEGFIQVLVPNIRREEIFSVGTVFILNFRDIDDKIYSAEGVYNNESQTFIPFNRRTLQKRQHG